MSLQLRKAKVNHFDLSFIRYHHIGRLDVPVDDILRMCLRETFGNLDGDIDGIRYIDSPLLRLYLFFEAFPFVVGHGDEELAFTLINFMNGSDVGVVQFRCGSGFVYKSIPGRFIACQFRWKKLQGDDTLEFCILGFVDITHASAAQLLDDLIMRYRFAYHRITSRS